MRRPLAAVVSLLLVVTAHAAQRKTPPPQSVDLVELDVAVLDGHGKPVTGLTARDFAIREDGETVDVKTFLEAQPTTPADPDNIRSIVLLLDDVAVPAAGTLAMQTIGKAFLESVDAHDELSVIRLNNRTDETFGDRSVAASRIVGFQAARFPFADFNTITDTLLRVADVSHQLEADDHRRKAVVCVGSPIVCNIDEPSSASIRPRHWSSWVEAVGASARANVAVYAIIPGRLPLHGAGLPDLTGGEVFATTYDVGHAIDRILQEASHYYMLGYWPSGKSREVHSIDVKVSRRGVKVHARRRRGN